MNLYNCIEDIISIISNFKMSNSQNSIVMNSSEVVYNVIENVDKNKTNYYMYNGELYTETFPMEWAKTHLPKTGPNECNNCAYFGSWNGVFIGYCANCALYEYKGKRGGGFIGLGKEHLSENYTSVFDTYLKDVGMDDIGDKKIMDTANIIMIEEINAYADTLFEQATEKPHVYERYDDCQYGSNYDGGYNSY